MGEGGGVDGYMRACVCVCVCRTLYGVTIQISCLWDKVPSMKNVCLMEYNNHVVLSFVCYLLV